ncbi:hypothetical protein [Nocardia sp. BMG51109]|uniref:hypothetical protein n=1 Tax=Nocardia sp. BMG51109 TaxID=1056816 RepID=UPI00046555EA|nr:hypothetical protein [Nocardia sp. BMG51109]
MIPIVPSSPHQGQQDSNTEWSRSLGTGPDSKPPDLDAELITMAVGGLAQGMLQGYSTTRSALELLDHLLDRILET